MKPNFKRRPARNPLYIAAEAVLLIGFFAALIMMGISFDLNSNSVLGDEASHTLQALSLANDFDLKFDASDGEYWKNLGWSDKPYGLFYQKYSGGYAFAKPYGYSLFTAVFVFLFGKNGFGVSNILIFFLLNLFIFMAVKSKYARLESLLLTIAFSFFSYVYLYVFFIHSDLFLAMLFALFVLLVIKLLNKFNWWLFGALALLTAFLVSEKVVFVLVLLPILSYVLYRYKSFRLGFIFLIIFSAGYLVFIMPYLHYSDYQAWNPYSGNRYYSGNSKFFFLFSEAEDVPDRVFQVSSGKYFEVKNIANSFLDFSKIKKQIASLYYYFFGAYTGLLAFIPLAIIAFVLSILNLDLKRCFNIHTMTLSALFLYILFYIVFFYDNYYGGGQSIGNRYFLQISPIIILIFWGMDLSRRKIRRTFFISLVLSTLFLSPHHLYPQNAHVHIAKTSLPQSYLPFESTQKKLRVYIAGQKKINAFLYPSKPKHILSECDKQIFVNNKKICLNDPKKLHPSARRIILPKEIEVFKSVFNEKLQLFANDQFHNNEKTHIWSPKRSKILIKSTVQDYDLSLIPYIKGTNIKITIDGIHRSYNLPVSLNLKFVSSVRKYVMIEFEADKSGIPKALGKSQDSRELSFFLVPEIRYPNRLETIILKSKI
jgi:hypothetical protein